jgi:hypothetical protein
MMNTTLNGPPRPGTVPRKSLAQQLDRMDAMLDGLSDGLSAAVADAVKDAVGQAVQAALCEVLAHPGVAARLAPAPPPVNHAAPVPAAMNRRPSLASRLLAAVRSRAARLGSLLRGTARTARAAIGKAPGRLARAVGFAWTLTRRNLRAVLLALAVGAAAGAACYFGGAVVAAAVSGVVTGMMAGAVRLAAPLASLFASDEA